MPQPFLALVHELIVNHQVLFEAAVRGCTCTVGQPECMLTFSSFNSEFASERDGVCKSCAVEIIFCTDIYFSLTGSRNDSQIQHGSCSPAATAGKFIACIHADRELPNVLISEVDSISLNVCVVVVFEMSKADTVIRNPANTSGNEASFKADAGVDGGSFDMAEIRFIFAIEITEVCNDVNSLSFPSGVKVGAAPMRI